MLNEYLAYISFFYIQYIMLQLLINTFINIDNQYILSLDIKSFRSMSNQNKDIPQVLFSEQKNDKYNSLIQENKKLQNNILQKDQHIVMLESNLNQFKEQINELEQYNLRLKQQNQKLQKQLKNISSKMNQPMELQKQNAHYRQREIHNSQKVQQAKRTGSSPAQSLDEMFMQASNDQQNQLRIRQYLQTIRPGQVDRYYNLNVKRTNYNWWSIKNFKQEYNIDLAEQEFYLVHGDLKINMEELRSNKNWNHIQDIYLWNCQIDDVQWKQFVEMSHLFSNLKMMWLINNNIATIQKGDLQRFNRLELVWITKNPLTQNTINNIKQWKQNKKHKNVKACISQGAKILWL